MIKFNKVNRNPKKSSFRGDIFFGFSIVVHNRRTNVSFHTNFWKLIGKIFNFHKNVWGFCIGKNKHILHFYRQKLVSQLHCFSDKILYAFAPHTSNIISRRKKSPFAFLRNAHEFAPQMINAFSCRRKPPFAFLRNAHAFAPQTFRTTKAPSKALFVAFQATHTFAPQTFRK